MVSATSEQTLEESVALRLGFFRGVLVDNRVHQSLRFFHGGRHFR